MTKAIPTMKRILLLLAALCAANLFAADTARKPNIIFILADDLGYGDIGPFGQKIIRTPTLDKMASEGMKFTQHYTGSPVCAPARCVLITGKHPGHAFIRDNAEVGGWYSGLGQFPIPTDEPSIATALKAAGYATGAFGKWGLGGVGSSGDPLKHGFDHFFGFNDQRQAHNYYPQYLVDDETRLPLPGNANVVTNMQGQQLPAGADPNNATNYACYTGKQYAPDLCNERALQFIRDHKDQPFFLYYPTTVPHLSLQVPEDSRAEYEGKLDDKPYVGGNGYLPNQFPHAAYAAEITRMDRDVGKMMRLVKALGLEDDTIFIFTSDNGAPERLAGYDPEFFHSNGELRGYKGDIYEGGIREPLIVRWPGHVPTNATSAFVSGFEDWMPTLLELAGAKNLVPKTADGISLAPTLLGKKQTERPFLYREFHGYGGQQSVRVGDWKLIHRQLTGTKQKPAAPTTELYDLATDPMEKANVAAAHPEIVARLQKILDAQHAPSKEFPFGETLDKITPSLPLLAATTDARSRPNIVLINADDLGYGDLGCYGATRVKTPNVDKLAAESLRFTDGYATSATCTPSRFSLLTGEYAFRQQGTGILPGDAPLIIPPGSRTLPAILQQAGYVTAAIGKWHLGLGTGKTELDWNGDIQPGPLEVGFNHCFILPATPDRVPCVYVQDHRVFNLDPNDPIRVSYRHPLPGEVTYKTIDHRELKMVSNAGHNNAVINGIGRIGYMTGGKSALWKDDEMEEVLSTRAVKFIEAEKDHPFFLYYASHDIHVPRVPNKRFAGKTGMGPRGDQIAEFDWAVGRILNALDRLKLADNTLVILTSDNGPVLDDGYNDEANELLGNHRPAGPLRGGKYSIFDGGTRVPLIVRWPGVVQPGVSRALVCQVDFAASFAALTGQKLGANEARDSENQLPTLLGESSVGRAGLVEYDQRREKALREGDWKYILPGETMDGLGPWRGVKIPAPGFLFNLASDPGETNNLAAAHPERMSALTARLAAVAAKPAPRPDETPAKP